MKHSIFNTTKELTLLRIEVKPFDVRTVGVFLIKLVSQEKHLFYHLI